MESAQAVRAAIARRAVKRTLGVLRRAAADLAAASSELDVVAEVEVEVAHDVDELLEAVRLARHSHPRITVVIVAAPTGRRHTPEP